MSGRNYESIKDFLTRRSEWRRHLKKELKPKLPQELPTTSSGSVSSECVVVNSEIEKIGTKRVNEASSSKKLTNIGIPLEDVEKEQERKKEVQRNHFIDLKRMLEDSDPRKATFVIMHITVIAEEPGLFTIPSEIGMTAFNVEDGIIDNYWSLIDHESIEPGFAITAYEKAAATGLPIPPFDPRYQDYGRIIKDIDTFMSKHLNQKSLIPKIYCLRTEMRQLSVSLRLLFNKCNRDNPYPIHSLDQLVRCISAVGIQGKWKEPSLSEDEFDINEPVDGEDPIFDHSASFEEPLPVWAEERFDVSMEVAEHIVVDEMAFEILSSHVFVYIKGVSCPYHLELDEKLPECALNTSNRLAYNALYELTRYYGIKRIISRHTAHQNYEKLEIKRRQELLSKWNIPYQWGDFKKYVKENEKKLKAQRTDPLPPSFEI